MKQSDGAAALKMARSAAELWVKEKKRLSPKGYPKSFNEKRGVFVSIHTKSGELRGCIGFPEPVYPLIKALVEASIAACKDPRFEPVEPAELGKLVIEASVLTKPEFITVKSPKEYPKKIKIGKDGLIVRKGLNSGLLLPQVATEWKWGAEEFLSNTCIKAGLVPDAWLDKETRIYKFQSEIFKEE